MRRCSPAPRPGPTLLPILLLLLLLLLLSISPANPTATPPTTTIDVAASSPGGTITFNSTTAAMTRAAAIIASGSSCILVFRAGVHSIQMTDTLFQLTGVAATPGSRLVIKGEGMLQTQLILATHGHDVIAGLRGTKHLVVANMTFARPKLTTTQGHLVAVNATAVTLELSDGFPSPDELLVDRIPRLEPEQGLFFRRFRLGSPRFPDGPRIVTNATCAQPNSCAFPEMVNPQVHFSCGGDGARCPDIVPHEEDHPVLPRYRVGKGPLFPTTTATTTATTRRGRTWTFKVAKWPPGEMARYRADIGRDDAIVGVKIKHGGQAFNLRHAEDVTFEGVRWLGHSRGICQDCSDVVLRHTRVERVNPPLGGQQQAEQAEQTEQAAMATPGGGPQINTCNNLTVFNHTAIGTGDDALGLFHIKAGSVTGCHIRDSFARGILLCSVSDTFAAAVRDNVVERCPIWRPPQSVHVNTC